MAEEPDILDYLAPFRHDVVNDDVSIRTVLIREVAEEVERLRAALKEIANDPGGYPAEDALDEVKEVARKVLGNGPVETGAERKLRIELDLERRRLVTSEELRARLVDLLRNKDAEIERLRGRR